MSIILSGDFIPPRNMPPYDLFSDKIKRLFQETEYVIVNLEAPLTERGRPILKTGKNFKLSPEYAKIIKKAGVDCVCLANNHIRDYGDEGVLDTIRYCNEAGLDVVGAGKDLSEASRPLIKDVDSKKVAFLNYCEREFSIAGSNRAGANSFDLINAYQDISRYKNEVDRIVVVYHGGLEYQHYPTQDMVKSFRFLIDIGADAVITHHAHAYSGFEQYKGKPIYYGLGNFLSHTSAKKPKDSWFSGLIANISFGQSDIRHTVYPVTMIGDMTHVDVSNTKERERVLQHITQLQNDIESPRFDDYWEKYYMDISDKTISNFIAPSRFVSRINKLLGIKKNNLSEYRTLMWTNSFRCVSHREKMIAILEKKHNDYRNYK